MNLNYIEVKEVALSPIPDQKPQKTKLNYLGFAHPNESGDVVTEHFIVPTPGQLETILRHTATGIIASGVEFGGVVTATNGGMYITKRISDEAGLQHIKTAVIGIDGYGPDRKPLPVPRLNPDLPESLDFQGQNVLSVDDINHSGRSFRDYLIPRPEARNAGRVYTAAVFHRTSSEFKDLDFWGCEIGEEWVVFWTDRRETDEILRAEWEKAKLPTVVQDLRMQAIESADFYEQQHLMSELNYEGFTKHKW